MIGYCTAGQMYVEWPCPAKACPQYEKCLKKYEFLMETAEIEFKWVKPK